MTGAPGTVQRRVRAAPRGLAVWLLVLALGGCATTPPSRFYTLRPLAVVDRGVDRGVDGGPTAGGGLGIGLGPVTFPAFLDRPQIVSRDAGGRLSLDEFNRWGGTLRDDFLRVFGENLGDLLGTSRVQVFPTEVRAPLDYRISADVLAFEATAAGEAVLKVRWAVLDPRLEQTLAARASSYRRPVGPPADQEAVTGAMSEVLGAFSEEVAAVLRGLPRPERAPAPTPLY